MRQKSIFLILSAALLLLSCEKATTYDPTAVYAGVTTTSFSDELLNTLSITAPNTRIVACRLNWEKAFPTKEIHTLIQKGFVPMVIWEPWVWNDPKSITFANILDEEWDDYITEFATDLKTIGYPVFIQWAPDANIKDLPWGLKNETDVILYKEALKHIVSRFRDNGANNAIWVQRLRNVSYPERPWNTHNTLYAGDDFVDWIGLSGFNLDTTQEWSEPSSFTDLFKEPVTKLSQAHPKKPIAIMTGTVQSQNTQWSNTVPTQLSENTPQIRMMIWSDTPADFYWKNSTPVPKTDTQVSQLLTHSIFNANPDKINRYHINYEPKQVHTNAH